MVMQNHNDAAKARLVPRRSERNVATGWPLKRTGNPDNPSQRTKRPEKLPEAYGCKKPLGSRQGRIPRVRCSPSPSGSPILSKEEFVLALINAVREKPILWKRHTKGYKDLKATHEAWNTLSERFGIQSEYLREKWKILRAQFRTNRTKLRMSCTYFAQ
uniref:MADF domain-containing protein n=1 Tax=Anopheles culicifacies TaxID=139723 RepID=A0A182MB06_9DIPT